MSSLQKKIKSRNTAVRAIEKAYENVNKFNEEDIIATIEVIENKFGKLCNLNSEIEELSEDVEDSEEICDNSLQSEINIRKKINALKSLVEKEKRQTNNSDAKYEGSKRRTVNLPKLDIAKFKGDYTKFNTFMDSFVAAIDSCDDLKDVKKFSY